MSSTFLHEDKPIPADEAVDSEAAPVCRSCGQPMWLIRLNTAMSDGGAQSVREFECKPCGTRRSVKSEARV